MEYVMFAINESWHWLGPLLVVSLGVACVAMIVEIVRDEKDIFKTL